LQHLGFENVRDLQTHAAATVTTVSQFLAWRALNVGQNTLSFIVRLVLMLYLLFFFLRDGADITRRITNAIPMRPELLHALASRFAVVVRATVKSNLVVAVLEGILGGLVLLLLGIRSPLLWGTLMGVLSLLPLVGPGLVWIPAALILLTTGSVWQGVVLIAYGVLVPGVVDNILRPLLVGQDISMPDYLVLISTLGGLVVFGVNGFIVGPLIAAMFVAAWDIFASERHAKNATAVRAADTPAAIDNRKRGV
jgi:predicted PurR-regulated permease PerM